MKINIEQYRDIETPWRESYTKYREYYELPQIYDKFVLPQTKGIFSELTQKYDFVTDDDLERFFGEFGVEIFARAPMRALDSMSNLNKLYYDNSDSVLEIPIYDESMIPLMYLWLGMNKCIVDKITFVKNI